MCDIFSCNNNSIFYLYGDNYKAKSLTNLLSEHEYKIQMIIDKKYNETIVRDSGIICCNIQNIDRNLINKDSVIVICMLNGLMHENVVSDIIKVGFENIIYLPMENNRPLIEQEKLRIAYNNLFDGNFEELSNIPKTKKLTNAKYTLIFEKKDKIAFLCPVKLLHTFTQQMYFEKLSKSCNSLDYEKTKCFVNIPVSDYNLYLLLYSYVLDKGIYPLQYLEYERKTEKDRELLLNDRRKLIEIFEKNFEYNFSFFLYSPAIAIWNDKGYFNIFDGYHRTMYLIFKGKKYIPIIVSKGDYEKFEKRGEND